MGSSLVSFCNSLGPVLGTNIAQSVFGNLLAQSLGSTTDADAGAIMNGGLGGLQSHRERDSFNRALQGVYIITIISSGLAFCCSLGMEWVNVKKKAS